MEGQQDFEFAKWVLKNFEKEPQNYELMRDFSMLNGRLLLTYLNSHITSKDPNH
jgi:hypothetical protein